MLAIANPETAWGFDVMGEMLGFVSWNGLAGLLQGFGGTLANVIALPGMR